MRLMPAAVSSDEQLFDKNQSEASQFRCLFIYTSISKTSTIGLTGRFECSPIGCEFTRGFNNREHITDRMVHQLFDFCYV